MASQRPPPKIFVVSNRLPITVKRTDSGRYDICPSSGGLICALEGLVGTTGFSWYGWPGIEVPEDDKEEVQRELRKSNAVSVFLEDEMADKYYNGFSNKILWPLLHYQMHEIKICSADWDAYQSVNRAFAISLVPVLEEGDVVWIQDYHLFLLPSYLRQLLELAKKKVKLGFFLHTVFPSSDFFRILPMRRDILEGLLACDVVGFHNHDYTTHFLESCEKILGLERRNSQIVFQNRTITALTNPIGIESEKFSRLLDEPAVQDRCRDLKEGYKGMQLMISVDRLDYIKGIPLRIAAIDKLLTKHPELVGKCALLQVIIPSREEVPGYQELHTSIDACVSAVNAKYGPIEYTPIQSLFSSVSQAELTSLYATADVCIVSSTRDGFNVVSLEYIACQKARHGVLLLSEFAGAAGILTESVKFNPWDADGFAEAIFRSLTMSEDEKESRWEKLNRKIEDNSSKKWGQTFLEALSQ